MSLYELANIPGKGKGLVATKEISPGSIILTEHALIVGPASADTCVECLNAASGRSLNLACPKCGHTLCELCFEKNYDKMVWHTSQECNLLTKIPEDPSLLFNIIFPLRFALWRVKNPKKFEALSTLQDHLEKRKKQKGRVRDSMVLMGKLLSSLFMDLSVEEAERLVATLLTNSFEMNTDNVMGRAFYPTISRTNHSCVPNLSHANVVSLNNINNNMSTYYNDIESVVFSMTLTTQTQVRRGDELTIRYSSVLEGFVERQKSFMSEWFFFCHCPRCQDSTEFETRMSAVKCPHCKEGFVIPLPKETYEETAIFNQKLRLEFPEHFICSYCFEDSMNNYVAATEENVLRHLALGTPGFEQTEKLLQACLPIFHDQHYVILMLKEAIISKNTEELKFLFVQEKYIRDVLQFLEVIDPGQTWKKFQILTKLKGVLLKQAKARSEYPNQIEFLRERIKEIQSISQALEKSKFKAITR